MRLPLVSPAHDTHAARPAWATRMAFAGASFIATGVALVLGTLAASPLHHVEVLSAGVTLAVAGGVLRSISAPARN